ncbi:MAG TPA: energy transducer TonB [Desulfomonilaceae bacterium]|nr:energy transducer TonB [Desulfomonilaceae bacterium]
MITVFPRKTDTVTPWMVAISVCLHAAAILVVVTVSFSVSNYTRAREEVRVRLVDSAAGPVLAEKMQRGPVQDAIPPPPAEDVEAIHPAQVTEVSREMVEPRAATHMKGEPVQLTKRKKPIRRLEAEKTPDKKKEAEKKKDITKKKEDPKTFLEQRLAAIRTEVETKKAQTASAQTQEPGSGGRNGQRNGEGADEDLQRWFNGVKSRVNSHWSLMDPKQMEKFTVIGVKIAENGELINASVDESSGDQVFDRSAMRAVMQAAPFPPLPPQAKAKISQAGGLALRFTPRGAQ